MESREPAHTPQDAAGSRRTAARLPSVAGYELLREIGRGGMGVVYEALHLKLNRTVALKMILAGEHAGERMTARFLKEAEIAAGLHHTNIVQIYELGEAAGLPFIAMELAGGLSLKDRILALGDDFRAVAALFEKLARATQWAHQHAVIHRDLKPANVLLGRDGEPKIGDFGLAKQLDDESALLTKSGEHMGTPAYMAPEQALAEPGGVGPAADIYALGAMLYEALTGAVPFKGNTQSETLKKLLEDEPAYPARLRPGLPRDLAVVCLKCLRKRPQERYVSAGELADDLRRFQNGAAIQARPPSPLEQSYRWGRRHPVKIAAAILLCAGAGIVAAVWMQQRDRAQEHEERFVSEYTETFANYVKEHGQFKGLGNPLTEEQRAHRLYSWQIVRAGREGHFLRMALVDSTGRPAWHWASPDLLAPGMLTGVPRHRLPCVFELHYNADGLVSEERLTDAAGQLVTRLRYTYPEGYDPSNTGTAVIQADFVDELGRPLETASGLSSVQLQRDPRGREHRLLYADAKGNPKRDADGTGGLEVEYEESGQVKTITALDERGRPAPNAKGKAVTRFTWDTNGWPLTMSWHDAAGQPILVDGYHIIRTEFDQWGNTVAMRCFDTGGQPSPNLSAGNPGASVFRWEPDAQGLVRTLTTSGYDAKTAGFASLVTHYDWKADGAVITRLECLDATGQQVSSGAGWRTLQEEFDPAGRQLRATSQGYDPKKTGYSRQVETTEWNARGNKQHDAVIFENEKGRPAADILTGARRRSRHYGPGERVERETLSGITREPYERVVIETTWENAGSDGAGRFPGLADPNTVSSDANVRQASPLRNATDSGIRALLTKGTAKRIKSTGRYLDKNGRPAACSSGNTMWEREYGPDGITPRLETHTGFLPARFPYDRITITTTLKEQAAGTTAVWEYLDASGRPVRNKDRYYKYAEDRDAADRLLSITKSGYDAAKTGYDTEVSEFSQWEGNIYRQRRWLYRHADGSPARYPDGYSSYTEEYDVTGVQTRIITSGYDPAIVPFSTQITLREPGTSSDAYRLRNHWEDAKRQPARGRRGERESIEEHAQNGGRLLAVESTGFAESVHGFERSSVRFSSDGTPTDISFTDGQGRPVTGVRPYICSVEPAGPGAAAGLQRGDIILSSNGQQTGSSFEFIAGTALNGGTLEILRAGKPLTLTNVPAGKLGIYLGDTVVKR